MPQKKSYITATDQFCGAGGSSTGAKNAGVEVALALNHWELAIETHNTNHPDTLHDCTDIQACDPRRYPSTDILITSPECTNHSLAKGKKRKNLHQFDLFDKGGKDEKAERSRATMWDVPRFAEYHNYNIIIVENVVDARYWVMWPAWIQSMQLLGYDYKCCFFNSMFFHPCPQSRDRMYVVFWKKGNHAPDLEFRPTAHCADCGKDVETYQAWKKREKNWGKFKQQYQYRCSECYKVVMPYYYAAFNCIDWSNPGTRIGDRKRPLAKKTIERIEYGINKYWKNQEGINNPVIVTSRYTSGLDCRVKDSTNSALPTQPGDASHGFLAPFYLSSEHSKASPENRTNTSANSLWTQTTTQSTGFVHPFLFDPKRVHPLEVSTKLNQQLLVGNYTPGWTRPTTRPTGTVTTDDHHGLFSLPLIVEGFGTSKSKLSSSQLGCITTRDKYGLLNGNNLSAFLSYYYGNGEKSATSLKSAIGTMTTRERASVIIPSNDFQIEDCYYRMLQPHEIQTAMAFPDDYVVVGNGRQKVKQLGNAVTPPVMEWLVKRCVDSLQ